MIGARWCRGKEPNKKDTIEGNTDESIAEQFSSEVHILKYKDEDEQENDVGERVSDVGCE